MSGILATATKTALRLDEVAEENLLLKRQVEVLAKEFSRHGHCDKCTANGMPVCRETNKGITCASAFKQWSLEQAKKGGAR